MARRIEESPEIMGLPAGSLEDKELTLAYQRGEDGAYQAIYDRYANRVHSVCRRMLGNSQDAQDAAQESFLRVYQALGRFNGRYQLGAWITRIATNVCLDHIRAKSRRPNEVVPLEVAELDTTEDAEVDAPDEVVIRRSEGRRVRRVLKSLPPMHRAAIVLRDFEGLSYQEVAVALGISEPQVKALIHRARQGFKRSWRRVGLSALFPTALVQRVRKVPGPKQNPTHNSSAHQLAESVTASAGPAASSCSAAFSQCGQFVADKFAPALTAMALGAASLTAPGLVQADQRDEAISEQGPAGQHATEVGFSRDSASVKPAPRRVKSAPPKVTNAQEPEAPRATSDDAAPPPSQRAAAAPVAPQPSPSSSPTSTPAPQPTSSSSPQKTQQDSGTQPPAGPPIVGVSLSPSTGSSRVPDSITTTFKCTRLVIDHGIATSVSRDSSSWPMRLELSSRYGQTFLEVGVMVASGEVLFTTAATLAAQERTADELRMVFSGTYRTRNMEARDVLGVAPSGNFQLRLTLDCASKSVIAETLSFEA